VAAKTTTAKKSKRTKIKDTTTWPLKSKHKINENERKQIHQMWEVKNKED
jgi:hypothetical protein